MKVRLYEAILYDSEGDDMDNKIFNSIQKAEDWILSYGTNYASGAIFRHIMNHPEIQDFCVKEINPIPPVVMSTAKPTMSVASPTTNPVSKANTPDPYVTSSTTPQNTHTVNIYPNKIYYSCSADLLGGRYAASYSPITSHVSCLHCGQQIQVQQQKAFNCSTCEDTGLVCENHRDIKWSYPSAPCCGGAGAGCDCTKKNVLQTRKGLAKVLEQSEGSHRRCSCDFHSVILVTGCVCGGV